MHDTMMVKAWRKVNFLFFISYVVPLLERLAARE